MKYNGSGVRVKKETDACLKL